MKTKQISVKEYADKINPSLFRPNRRYPDNPITVQTVKHRIKKGMELPLVYKYTKIGKVHVLTVHINF